MPSHPLALVVALEHSTRDGNGAAVRSRRRSRLDGSFGRQKEPCRDTTPPTASGDLDQNLERVRRGGNVVSSGNGHRARARRRADAELRRTGFGEVGSPAGDHRRNPWQPYAASQAARPAPADGVKGERTRRSDNAPPSRTYARGQHCPHRSKRISRRGPLAEHAETGRDPDAPFELATNHIDGRRRRGNTSSANSRNWMSLDSTRRRWSPV